MEKTMLEIESIFVRTDEMSDQVFMRGAVIENFDVRGGLEEDLGMGSGEGGGAREAEKQRESRDPTRDPYKNSLYQWFLVARSALFR
jgi:hypothetical protein